MFCTAPGNLLKSNMASMKRTDIICILLVILANGFSLVSCGRQKPQHDEIERIINETHSVIWKCSVAECPHGMGLSVPCGTSVPFSASIECVDCVDGANYSATHDYSQCKSCTNCSANEKTSGHCTTSEDTTKCLKTCLKGFYWDNITADSCHPCSDCCGENLKHHEEQCEKSGLPISHQCQQTYVKLCQRPTAGRRETLGTRLPTANKTKDDPNDDPNYDSNDPNDDPEQRSLSSSKIAGIVVGCILFAVIVLGFVIWKFCGWQRAKTILKNCCCCNQGHVKVMTFNFYDPEGNGSDLESAPCLNVSGSHSEEADKKGFLTSGLPAVNRPGYHRMFSVPAEFNDTPKAKTDIHRSNSHPGCLKDLSKDTKDNKPGSPKKCPRGWSLTKKFGKKGYLSVPTDPELPDVIVQNPGAEREEKPRNLGPPTVVAKDQCTSTTGLDHHVSTINPASEFQCCLLSRRMATIPIPFYRKICNKLDVSRELIWDDYRMFGEKIGLNRDEILLLGQSGKPTDLMIMQKFDSQRDSSIGKFKEIMEEMERDDVVTVIKDWVLDEWEKSNV